MMRLAIAILALSVIIAGNSLIRVQLITIFASAQKYYEFNFDVFVL